MIRSFWATQWPGGAERDRDASIKAVLNKLGAFVTYDSIRAVIGQGTSTIRPRDIMDRGDVLLVDLSGVGGDNATLFGAMLVSRFYVDALGRQAMDPADRRQHLLLSMRRIGSAPARSRTSRSRAASSAWHWRSPASPWRGWGSG